MVIFEIIDDAVKGSDSGSHDASINETVKELQAFAGDIRQSLGLSRTERSVVVFEDRGLGIRYGNRADSVPTRGIEIQGKTSVESIVAKLY